MNDITEMGKVLSVLRLNNNETARDQAKRLGVNASYISSIAYGRVPLAFKLGQKIFHEYKLERDQIKTLLEYVFNENVVFSCLEFGFDLTSFAKTVFAYGR